MNEKQYLQCPENGAQHGFSTQFPIIAGTFSPTGTFNDIYPGLIPQNSIDRSQNKPLEPPYALSEMPTWESLKLPEKIDLIELSSKDLSPSSYCSNIDNILPPENQYNRYEGHQWSAGTSNFNYTQKSGEYPSCAHISKYYGDTNTPTYCSIQKGPIEGELFRSCAYYNTNNSYNQNKPFEMPQSIYSNYSSYYDPKFPDISSSNSCYVQNSAVYDTTLPGKPQDITNENEKQSYDLSYLTPIDQQTEASNDESDIIVEDSSSDCSEEHEKQLFYDITKCLLCNTMYTPLRLQFYVLTSENPLTMSSQTPVIKKILEIVDNNVYEETNYLCNDCLGLINTIDHLQLKLKSIIKNLLDKFKKSCVENNIEYKTKEDPSKNQAKFRKYKCKQCKKILCLKTYFANHIKTHKNRGYLCELCGKIAPTFKRLKYHIKKHKKSDSTQINSYKCSNKHCSKIFRTTSHRKEHENFCLGILPFKCKNQFCDKKFASATKLKNHTKLKHDKKFIAICSICNIGFVKISDYKSHMITHNTDTKFECNKCEKSYKTLSNLNFHLKTHEKTLPFTCPICHKGFVRKEYHEAHINGHKGIKNFGCSVCDKKFVSQKNLDAHLKYHEGSVKTNTCNICGKVITSGFEEHLRIHSNLKEFECDICDMKFNTKNTLAKHKKRKHLKGENIGKS